MIKEQIKLNDLIEIEIKKLGINGEGIGYYHKLAVFVDNALPGEIITAKVTEIFSNRLLADIEEIKVKSPDRLEVMFPEYELCGAYSMQHVTYEKSLQIKRDILINALNPKMKPNGKRSSRNLLRRKSRSSTWHGVTKPTEHMDGHNV